MNSKWLPLTAVVGFVAVIVSQAIAPASADAHDDWVRRHRNDARSHRNTSTRITTTRNRALPVHTGAWHVNQANASNARNGRGTTSYQRVPSAQWNNRTDHRNKTDHHNNTDHH